VKVRLELGFSVAFVIFTTMSHILCGSVRKPTYGFMGRFRGSSSKLGMDWVPRCFSVEKIIIIERVEKLQICAASLSSSQTNVIT